MLDWRQAALLTVVLLVIGGIAPLVPDRPRLANRVLRGAGPFAREGAIIAGLYGVWQLAGSLSVLGERGAFARARWIVSAERFVHLPDEADLQRFLVEHASTAHVANFYYATMHFSVMGVFLIWLFVRHRDRYRPVRRVLAVTTLICLLIALLPVAPPRLLTSYGFIDVAARFGESVYGNGTGFTADQLSAMPSVHVAWAVLVGAAVWTVSDSRWRFIGPLHTVLTVLIVVATGNHYWADGIVAVAVLVLSVYLVRVAERVAHVAHQRWRQRTVAARELSQPPVGSVSS